MGRLIKPKTYAPKPLSLSDFHKKRNTVLIWHEKGGLGDVFMQRMMLEDFRKILPSECELVFACLPEYIDAVKDHPSISKVIDARTVNPKDYMACFNTCVTIADRFENYHAPYSEHRSDIWAKSCGVTLQNHEMHIKLSPSIEKMGRSNMELLRDGKKPLVAFAPISKMIAKSLLPKQMAAIIEATRHCTLVGIHTQEIKELTKMGISGIYGSTILEWMSHINAADYVISVDTATFHLAGGLKKPLVGIFTFADGKIYGKYFDFILVQKHKDNGDWDCGPCFKFGDCPKCRTLPKPCLTEITPEMIEDGVRKMFEKWAYKRTSLPIVD